MAHNFRRTGNLYLSKAGNDSNAGNSPDAPLFSIDRAAAISDNRIVIGTGSYRLNFNTLFNNSNFTWVADGTVKILGDGQTAFFPLGGAQGSSVDGIYYDQFGGFSFHGFYGGANYFSNSLFKVIASNAGVANSTPYNDGDVGPVIFSDSIFFNLNLPPVNANNCLHFTRCIFINCKIGRVSTLDSCYIDSTSAISGSIGQAIGTIKNNNVDPACNTAAGFGVSLNGGQTFVVQTPGGISAPPLFNSVAKEDFTLRAASQHITKGIGPASYRYANSFYFEFSGSSGDEAGLGNLRLRATGTNAVVPLLDITSGSQGFEVNSQGGVVLEATPTSIGYGSVTTGRIPFSDIPYEMGIMFLKSGLNYDSVYPALESQFNMNLPEVYNNNVPDASNYTSGSSGRNPNRLSYKMRWSTKLNPNADLSNISDWVTGADFIEFEWNQKPLWNPATKTGNGEAGFDPNSAQPIVCTFYQLIKVLRNNYYH